MLQFKNLLNGRLGSGEDRKINLTEFLILQGVVDKKTLTEIRQEINVTKAAISQNLTSLRKKEYITQEKDESNRRQLIITLTKQGQVVLQETNEFFDQGFAQFLQQMGQKELLEMLKQMERMIDILGK
ncbi:MAG: transcriptional regulator, partial [Streptococcaceae bacterium]|nr:transcriptional regulator [Streptococcaceae bacterium]